MKRILGIISVVFLCMSFMQESGTTYVRKNITQLKEGVLLVRMHEHLKVQEKMLELKQYKSLKKKKEEVAQKNKEIIHAFSDHYSFSEVYFFYARNTRQVVNKAFQDVILDTALVPINTELIANKPIYILDGEHVYFENFGEDADGYAIYNDTLGLLEKPFPFFVRKRSGTLIVKRSENDMVIKLQEKLDKTYQKYGELSLD